MEVAGGIPGVKTITKIMQYTFLYIVHNLSRNVNVLLKHMESNSSVSVAMSGRLRTHLDFAACLMTGSYLVTLFLPVSRRLVVMWLD